MTELDAKLFELNQKDLQYRLINDFNLSTLSIIGEQLAAVANTIGKLKPVPMPHTASGETGMKQTDRLLEKVKDAIATAVLIRMRIEKGGD